MTETNTFSQQPIAAPDFDAWSVLARLEVDRFCEGCGYNLRSAAVKREPGMGILVCRCSECRKFHAANDGTTAGQLWLRRWATMQMWLVIIGLATLVLLIGIGQFGLSLVTLDEIYRYMRTYSPPGTSWLTDRLRTANAIAFSLLPTLGACGTFLVVVTLPHWKRWGYVVFAVALPTLVSLLVWQVLLIDHPHLPLDAKNPLQFYLLYFTLATVGGGMVMVYAGRPLARLLVRLLLVPRLRAAMGYLWLADGLALPTMKEK